MGSGIAKACGIAAGVLLAMLNVGAVMRAPVYVSFSLAVVEAVSWCFWIEHRPRT